MPSRISHPNLKKHYKRTIQNINFVDAIQIRRAHEALMHEVHREVRCIGTKYSVKMGTYVFQVEQAHSNIREALSRYSRGDIEL